MSVYTIRYVEGKFDKIKDSVPEINDLPDNASVGDVYRVYQGEFPYYKKTEDSWKGQNKCETYWRLLSPLQKLDREPKKNYITMADGTKVVEYSESSNLHKMKDSKGNDVFLKSNPSFWNNGGAIRDEYIGNDYFDEFPYRDRDFPEDMSKELIDELTDPDDGSICSYGYHKTWVTISEWLNFYDSEEQKLMNKIQDFYIKKANGQTNKKLDFIIKNMKSPIDAKVDEFFKDMNKTSAEEDDEFADEQYEMQDIKDMFLNLYQIAEEIGKAEYLSDMYDIYNAEDVRIIYYLEN